MAWGVGIAANSTVLPAAETLDRVVASIGNMAITASDVEQEYRFERFLDGQWPPLPPGTSQLAAARDRLANQMVLEQEENPSPTDRAESEKAAAARLAELRKHYAQPGQYEQALKDLGMSEAALAARVTQQELILRLIDQRLRPAASPSDDEITAYYRSTFAPEFEKKNGGAPPPPLPEVAGQIREILTQKRVNELLDEWIEELRPTTNLRIHIF